MHVILSVKAQYCLAFVLNCCNIKMFLFGCVIYFVDNKDCSSLGFVLC